MDTLAQAAPSGTSLEILAPYLPYGIEVEVIEPYGGAGQRETLRGLDPRLQFPALCGNYSTGAEFAYHGILPVLRPFSALCDPLPDGTVPAVEVAKLVLGNPHFLADEKPAVEMAPTTLMVRFGSLPSPIVVMGNTGAMCWVDSENNANPPVKYLAAIEYLRRNYFALPVNGRPLIEGVDFISKSAPAPAAASEKGGAND